MAAETSSVPVNGNYAAHQGLGAAEHNNNYTYADSTATSTTQVPLQPPPTSTTPASTISQTELSKDEVGWYFVEQYYTTLSRNPERLYLFYNKRSQFVSGMETDKVRVYGGQNAINNRIKELDFKDCKVRVTNVDAQASESNIVIQVIGEMSNKSQPHKKFAQTFVLATQTNGYFVLNDIFRYLMDEEEELEVEGQAPIEDVQQATVADGAFQEPPPTPREGEQKTLTSSDDPVQVEQDAQELDKEIEAKAVPEPEEKLPAAVNGVAEPEAAAYVADEPPYVAVAPAAPVVTEVAKEVADKPTEAAPIPTTTLPKQATPQPAAAPKPAAPKTWASMAASANKVATPLTLSAAVTPDSQQARSVAASTKTATPPAPAPAAAPSAPAAPAAQHDEVTGDASQGDEWTAVGGSHTRQQSRQTGPQQQDGPTKRIYIKNLTENTSTSELKSHLEQYGDFVYFDRPGQKNFIQAEYATPESFAAAMNGNPHTINGERIIVEPRRFINNRAGFQGGRGRGGMAPNQPRGNFGGRGGFPGRGRGGNMGTNSPTGRGDAPQAA